MSLDAGRLTLPAIVVHGGAGTLERARAEPGRSRLAEGLAAALDAGWTALARGGGALTAAVEAVASMEDSGLFNAGRGSVPNSTGAVETDAAVMDGATGAAGGVCTATFPANPVRAALLVAALDPREGGAVLVAGQGADDLAAGAGLTRMDPALLTGALATPPASEQGTVGAVAVDAHGHVAAATSTGGRRGQPPGRVGDTPIIGAGTWADDATAAVSATGAGEQFVLAGFAHLVDWELRQGRELDAAIVGALDRVAGLGGDGGAVGLTAQGRFVAAFDTAAMARGWRDASGARVKVLEAGTG